MSATVTAKLFPRSSVARAFSHQLAETLWLRGRREPGTWAIGYAADDSDTANATADIITQTGFVPVPSRHARPIGVHRSRGSALPWSARSHQPTRYENGSSRRVDHSFSHRLRRTGLGATCLQASTPVAGGCGCCSASSDSWSMSGEASRIARLSVA